MCHAIVELPNNGHVGDECFVEVVPSSEVLTCIQLLAGGMQFVHCREVVRSSECPLSEVPLYNIPVCCECVDAVFAEPVAACSDLHGCTEDQPTE